MSFTHAAVSFKFFIVPLVYRQALCLSYTLLVLPPIQVAHLSHLYHIDI
nr:MAG TPA: hypothetical protein [Caudoviricetes sp.]